MAVFDWLKGLFRKRALPGDLRKAENAIGYHFKNPDVLYRSLKHRSYAQAMDGDVYLSNERLEFLGDSVLNMIVSFELYSRNPDHQEGDLTKLKSILVSKESAAIAAKKVQLERFILLSTSEEGSGGRKRISIIADLYEAVIGAIFVDGGYDPAQDFVRRTLLRHTKSVLSEIDDNYKSFFLELTQAQKFGHPVYRTISEEGPDHDKLFTVEVFVKGRSYGIGTGRSKKAAQQMAAKEGLDTFRSIHDIDE